MSQAFVFFIAATAVLSLCQFFQVPATVFFIGGAGVTFFTSILDDVIEGR